MTHAFIYIFVVFVSKNREKRSKKRKIGHFAECLSQYTRQSGFPQDSTTVLCRVLKPWHSAKFQMFAECQDPALGRAATWRHPGPALCRVPGADTRQTFETLPSARVLALGKAATCCPVEGHFAECIGLSTRQSGLFFFLLLFSLFFDTNTTIIYI